MAYNMMSNGFTFQCIAWFKCIFDFRWDLNLLFIDVTEVYNILIYCIMLIGFFQTVRNTCNMMFRVDFVPTCVFPVFSHIQRQIFVHLFQ